MKKITSFLMLFLMCFGSSVWAQLPEGMISDVNTGTYHYYAIKSLKSGRYVFAAYDQTGRLTDSKNTLNAIWYFVKDKDNGVHIKSCLNPELNVSDAAKLGKADATYEFSVNGAENNAGFNIKPTGNIKGWNDHQGFGRLLALYQDDNSINNSFAFEEVSELPVSVKAEDITAEGAYYTIQHGRTSKFASFKDDASLLEQDQQISNASYFFIKKVDGGFTIQNLAGYYMTDKNKYEATSAEVVWTIENVVSGNNVNVANGLVLIRKGNGSGTYLNASGGLDNDDNGTLDFFTLDNGCVFILNKVDKPKFDNLNEPYWHDAANGIEDAVNGIKFSDIDPDGNKYYYTIESKRQVADFGAFLGFRYLSDEDGKAIRTVKPDSENNKWFFLKGDKDGNTVVIANAATGRYLNSIAGNMHQFSYKKFLITPSKELSDYKCITDDKVQMSVNDSRHCIDANFNDKSLSTGWFDGLDGGGNPNEGVLWKICEVQPIDLDLAPITGDAVKGTTKTHIASFSSPLNVTIPQGVDVYTVAENPGNTANLVKFDGQQLPANTGVFVLGDVASCKFSPVFTQVGAIEGNLLKSTSNRHSVVMAANDFVLATPEAMSTQLYKAKEGSTLAQNKAYLNIANAQAAKMSLNFGDAVTGIEGVEAEGNVKAAIYDLSGRRVNNTVKGGIYIQNGKKFIVK